MIRNKRKKDRILKVINDMVPSLWYNPRDLAPKAKVSYLSMTHNLSVFRRMGLMERKFHPQYQNQQIWRRKEEQLQTSAIY